MPVMEGKALLFKEFAGVDAFPICLDTKDADEIVDDRRRRSRPSFGGINLEDIAAPGCFEVEERLDEIARHPRLPRRPARHRRSSRSPRSTTRSSSSTSASTTSRSSSPASAPPASPCPRSCMDAGVQNVIGCDREGAIYRGRDGLNASSSGSPRTPTPTDVRARVRRAARAPTCSSACRGRTLVTVDDVKHGARPDRVRHGQPDPEIRPEADRGHVAVIATGRSDYPEPDQQRARLPRRLPGRARRPRAHDHRDHEGRRGPRHRRGRRRERARRRLHHPVRLQPRRRARRRDRGRPRGRGRRRRARHPRTGRGAALRSSSRDSFRRRRHAAGSCC